MVSPSQVAATRAAAEAVAADHAIASLQVDAFGHVSPTPYDYHDDYATPADVFESLHREFNFACDLAACSDNHRLPDWLGEGGLVEDSLTVPWHQLAPGRWLWLNAPFRGDLLRAFMAKVAAEAAAEARIVTIIPAHRTEQAWWHVSVIGVATEVRSIVGRVAYELHGRALEAWRVEEAARASRKGCAPKTKPNAPNFPSCLAVYDGVNHHRQTRIVSWSRSADV